MLLTSLLLSIMSLLKHDIHNRRIDNQRKKSSWMNSNSYRQNLLTLLSLLLFALHLIPSPCTTQNLYTSNSDIISLYSNDFYEVEGPLPPGKSAFAMLVYNMTDVTLDMVMTPLYSLIRSNISVPTILMVTPEVEQSVRRLVKDKLGIHVFQVPPLPLPEKYVSKLQATEYLLLFTKMYAWLWSQYESVCIIDMDMLVLRNPEGVLKYPLDNQPFAATFGQCGFFCLRPSSTMFLKLLRLAQFELDYSPGLGDQFFYQKVFGDLTWQIPPIPGYNTVGFPATKDWTFFHNDTYIPVKHFQIKSEDFTVENVVMYHFNGIKRKPWLRTPPKEAKIDYHNDAYFLRKWWDIRNEMHEKLAF